MIVRIDILNNLNLCRSILLREDFDRFLPFKFGLNCLLPDGRRYLFGDGFTFRAGDIKAFEFGNNRGACGGVANLVTNF